MVLVCHLMTIKLRTQFPFLLKRYLFYFPLVFLADLSALVFSRFSQALNMSIFMMFTPQKSIIHAFLKPLNDARETYKKFYYCKNYKIEYDNFDHFRPFSSIFCNFFLTLLQLYGFGATGEAILGITWKIGCFVRDTEYIFISW